MRTRATFALEAQVKLGSPQHAQMRPFRLASTRLHVITGVREHDNLVEQIPPQPAVLCGLT